MSVIPCSGALTGGAVPEVSASVAHFVIDGAVRSALRSDPADRRDLTLSPDAIAQSYLDLLRQRRSAGSWDVELRPWVENF